MQWNSDLETTKREKMQLFFIVLFIYATTMTDIVRLLAALTGSGAIRSMVNVVRNGLYVGVFAGYYFYADNKARLMGIGGTLLYVMVLLSSLLINPELQAHVVSLSLLFVARHVLGFVMIATLNKPVHLCRGIVKLAWLVPLYLALYAITPHDTSSGSSYSISLSYNVLLPAMACLISAYLLQEKRIYCVILSVVAIGGIVFYGSRGTLICAGLGVLCVLILNRQQYSLKRFVLRILLVACVIVVLSYKAEIVEYLLKLAPDSRTLKLFANESFLWTSNRDKYLDFAKEALESEPFRIYGIGGDAYYYSMQARKPMDLGMHSHNIFLEFLLSYGLLIGGLLCTMWLLGLLCSIIKIKGNKHGKMLFILFVVPLIPLVFISGSTCQSHYHWLQLGALANCVFYVQSTRTKNLY